MGQTYITRFEYGRSRGWFARPPGKPGKLFSDGVCGGRSAALKAAERYRGRAAKRLYSTDGRRLWPVPGSGRVFIANKDGVPHVWATIRTAPNQSEAFHRSTERHGRWRARELVADWLQDARKRQARNYRRLGVEL